MSRKESELSPQRTVRIRLPPSSSEEESEELTKIEPEKKHPIPTEDDYQYRVKRENDEYYIPIKINSSCSLACARE